MEQNVQVNDTAEITIFDIFSALRKKLKLIICLTLIAAVIGGALGCVISIFTSSYGAVVSFHVSSFDDSDSLLYNLQSEAFAEKLLLDENGLPPKDQCDAAAYEEALNAINALNEARKEKYDLRREINMLPYSLSIIEEEYARLSSAYNNAYSVLNIYKSAPSDKVAEDDSHKEMIKIYEQKLIEAEAAKNAYAENVYNPAIENKLILDGEFARVSRKVADLRDEVEKLVEIVVAPWRENKDVKKQVADIMKGVSYEYEKLEASEDNKSTSSTKEEPHKGYIKITVSIERDKEFAKFVVDKVKSNVAPFVINNIEAATGDVKVKCTLISTFGAVKQTGDGMISGAVRYAMIVAIAVAVVVCGVIILKLMVERMKPDNDNNKAIDESGGESVIEKKE
jgi:capsular polysaccharide biosynthesis protein